MQYILTSWFLLILLMVPMGISAQDLDKFSLKNPVNVSVKLSSTATFILQTVIHSAILFTGS